MKTTICFRFFLRATFLSAVIVFVAGSAAAQHGAWISHAVPTVYGGFLAKCGDRCLGYAHQNDSSIFFYDIGTSQWTKVELSSAQTFHDLIAPGNIIFAYTDSFLIAYSALVSAWDTVRYLGTPLPNSAQPPNYACSSTMAMFVTTQRLYIFDGEMGKWKSYNYGLPSNYDTRGTLIIKNDYAAMVLARPLGSLLQHTVYSQITKSFNQIDSYAAIFNYDHGYVGMGQVTGSQDEYLGYCAASNNFSILTLNDVNDVTYGSEHATSWGVHCDRSVNDGTHSFELHCYDTRLGIWSLDTATYHYDANSGTEVGSPRGGDHFIRFGSYTFPPAYTEGITTYFGQTGQFTTIPFTLFINQSPSISSDGSTIFMEGGNSSVLAWDVLNGRGCATSISHDNAGNCFIGEDYCSFSEWNATSDSMVMQFYNRSTNAWINVPLPKSIALSGVIASDAAYAMPFPVANPFALFYSSITNSFTTATFSPGDLVEVDAKGIFARALSLNKTYLFDAQSGIIHNISADNSHISVGDTVAVYYEDDNTIHGYSGLSKKWTSVTMDEPAYWLGVKGCIGLISTQNGGIVNHKFYAFNGLHDSWVELPSSGLMFDVGDRTALVVRSDTMYAFDPSIGTTGVNQEHFGMLTAYTYQLFQNYPNPFNPTTVINYQIPMNSFVTLKVYDVIGREVKSLVNELQSAGSHVVTFDASSLSSGVYFCRLVVGRNTDQKKMLLIK